MSASEPTMVPLGGGYSGETFLAEMAGERTVVRIYAENRRGSNAAEVDAAVLRLVHGLLPVPEVLEVRRGDGASGAPGLLVTSFLPGTPLDRLLPSAPDGLRRTVGHELGALLARLAQMPMPRSGVFADADLRIGPLPPGLAGLPEWVDMHRDRGAFTKWSQQDLAALGDVADDAQVLLDRLGRTCLVHGDFNPKNLLVDPDGGAVTGLVDWEFAHAGMPVTDLGNLLRFERHPAFADAVLQAFVERVPDAEEGVLDQARAADLFALVELAARRDHNPVAERAHDLLRAIARAGDLHAVP